MFVKTEFTGASMMKYSIASFVVKIAIFVLFIAACVPNGTAIINHVQNFLNNSVSIDLYFILKQIGWMFLWLVVAIVIEVAVIFGIIFPMAKSEMNNNW